MNRNRFILLLGFLLGPAFGELCGQPPENPVLRTPPPGSSWSLRIERPDVSIKQKEKAPEPGEEKPGKPEAVALPTGLVMKTDRKGISMGQISYADGRQETFYISQGLLVVKAGNTGKIMAVPAGNSDLYSMKVAGFPGTAWISPGYQMGMQRRGDQDCHYFLYDVPEGDPERPSMKMEAWVQKNGYPLEILIHGEMSYHFGKMVPFEQDIQLPEAFRAVLAQRGKQRAALDLIRKSNQDP